MWKVDENKLQMTVGDYGVKLPMAIDGIVISQSDTIRFTFADAQTRREVLSKDFYSIQDNEFNLEFTLQESALFPIGYYIYSVDWFQNGVFMCNLIEEESFKVVRKV